VGEDDVAAVVRMAESAPNVMANPRAVTEDDARGILEAAW
jgi:alcohol dehydrogenase class IV